MRKRFFLEIPFEDLIRGILSFIPFSYLIYKRVTRTGSHSGSMARFCYSLWMRIFVTVDEIGHRNCLNNIGELGPSSSFGVGLAALITGAKSYTALDVVHFEIVEKNLILFDEIVTLFRNKTDIPNDEEFPQINLKLGSYKFPEKILTNEVLTDLLHEDRIEKIREAILNYSNTGISDNSINYLVPWSNFINELKNSFDFVFSRAVMEHIDDYAQTYFYLNQCMKSNAIMLHDIEYHNHKIGKHWNMHWCFPNVLWTLIKGKRPFITNRATHSMHITEINKNKFQIIKEYRNIKQSKIKRGCVSKKFKNISDEDFQTFGGCIIAIRK